MRISSEHGDLERLLADHGPAMYRTARKILGRDEEAEDCVQNVLVELMLKAGRQEVRNWAALSQWLVAARAVDRLRQLRRQHETASDPLDAVPSGAVGPASEVAANEMRDWFRSALTQLPLRQSEVFVLRHVAGMSHSEIASALGSNPNAVAAALHAARRQLQAMLPEDWLDTRERRVRRGHADA